MTTIEARQIGDEYAEGGTAKVRDDRIKAMAEELAAKDREVADLARALINHKTTAEVLGIRAAARERR